MPRVARIVVPGLPHHVTQRGNNREPVFFSDEDRRAYLMFLGEQCNRHGVRLLGYCLMNNHVHLIPIPRRADSLAKAIGRTHWLYAQHVNQVHDRTGHLWQSRFYSNAMDDDHCLLATRYVEWNPIRSGICRIARRYEWSSAAAHCTGEDPSGLLDLRQWDKLTAGMNWEQTLTAEPTVPEISSIRAALKTGRPLAADRTITRMEKKLGKTLRAKPKGRPKKTKEMKYPSLPKTSAFASK